MSEDTARTGPAGNPASAGAPGGNGLAVAGLVCGLVGLLLFSIVLGPLAVIFGGVAWARANRGAPRRGMAIAAVVLGVVDLVIFVVLLAAAAGTGGSIFGTVG
jgi:uncharacterized protein DUF4190